LRSRSRELSQDRRLIVQIHPDHPSNSRPRAADGPSEPTGSDPGGLVLLSRLLPPMSVEGTEDETFTTEDDTASATVAIPLDDHNKGVEELADRYGRLCGLAEPVRLTLAVAARWHDLGKADERFQAWLHDGDARVAGMAPRLLAKSGGLPQGKPQRERARAKSGYPRGARHELVSVRLAEKLVDPLDQPVDRDLLLHLIASHHGHARPFAPYYPESGEAVVTCERIGLEIEVRAETGLHRLDSGVGERFWELVRRYGWWGLSYLEALLRLADHRRSEEEQRDDGDGS